MLNDLTKDKTESCFCRSKASACHYDMHTMDNPDCSLMLPFFSRIHALMRSDRNKRLGPPALAGLHT